MKSYFQAKGISMSSISRRHYGFTIVELLVVISIVALLLSLLLPVLSNARQQVEFTRCLNLQRQVFISLSTYATDYRQYPSLNVPCNIGNVFNTYPYPDGGFCQCVEYRWINGYSGLKCLLEDKNYIATDMTRCTAGAPAGVQIAWYDLSPSPWTFNNTTLRGYYRYLGPDAGILDDGTTDTMNYWTRLSGLQSRGLMIGGGGTYAHGCMVNDQDLRAILSCPAIVDHNGGGVPFVAYEPHLGYPKHPSPPNGFLGDSVDDKLARNFMYNDGHGISSKN
jgi:prepilin-type N-terminal cleavage/methylation domain-containing protein